MDDGLAECCGQGGRGERRSGWAPWTAHRRVLFRRQSDTTKDSGHAPSGHCVDNSPAALDGGTNRPRHLRDFRYRRRQTRGTPARDPATKVTHARLIVCDGRGIPLALTWTSSVTEEDGFVVESFITQYPPQGSAEQTN